MSIYPFAPSPAFGIGEQNVIYVKNAFGAEELTRLVTYLETLNRTKAYVGSGKRDEDISRIRISEVAWVHLNDKTRWFYEKLANIARKINGKHFRFDLYGFYDHMQYTIYEGDAKSHYDWHTDSGNIDTDHPPRKLSLILQLSSPGEYEGGELEVMSDGKVTRIPKQQNLLVAFPSYTVHRVKPVTSGIRRSLVIWVCGPAFR